MGVSALMGCGGGGDRARRSEEARRHRPHPVPTKSLPQWNGSGPAFGSAESCRQSSVAGWNGRQRAGTKAGAGATEEHAAGCLRSAAEGDSGDRGDRQREREREREREGGREKEREGVR